MSPRRPATSASVVERAPLVLNSFAAQDNTAARLVSRCKPRLKGERFVEDEVAKRFLSIRLTRLLHRLAAVILKVRFFEL